MIFTNEDGGTPTDRLMATWGRTTDIEYIYSVEVDRAGAILAEDIQGPKHEILPYRGKRDGRHPLLWVSTDNNMVLDSGSTAVRYAPAPEEVRLHDVSRETVMDAHPWLYELAHKELQREGKIVPGAPPGNGRIPDHDASSISKAADKLAVRRWRSQSTWAGPGSHPIAGMRDYRIARDGCFRAAVPLPQGATARDIRAVRAQAYTRRSRILRVPPVPPRYHPQ